jgi:hypothetical protein
MEDEAAIAPKAHEGTSVPAADPSKNLQWVSHIFSFCTTVVEKFGWPGAFLFFGGLFIVWYATEEQKRSIIDLYVLGNGIGNVWPLILISGVFALTVFAQYRSYRSKVQELQDEIDREGRVKSALQEKLLGRSLQHGTPPKRKRR